jgi:hypothetical protein
MLANEFALRIDAAGNLRVDGLSFRDGLMS